MYFCYLSFWNRAWPFIWTNLNFFKSRMLCAKFGGLGEEDNKAKSLELDGQKDNWQSEKLTWAFDQLRWAIKRLSLIWEWNILLFVKIWIIFTQGWFVLRLIEIGPETLKKKILKTCKFFSVLHFSLPPYLKKKKIKVPYSFSL